MVSVAEMQFYTGITVADTDMATYTTLAEQHLCADGGETLADPMRTEALAYLIASKIANKNREGMYTSENISGYSYSKKAETSTSGYWYDLYREILSTSGLGGFTREHCKGVQRVDKHILHIQRRYF